MELGPHLHSRDGSNSALSSIVQGDIALNIIIHCGSIWRFYEVYIVLKYLLRWMSSDYSDMFW